MELKLREYLRVLNQPSSNNILITGMRLHLDTASLISQLQSGTLKTFTSKQEREWQSLLVQLLDSCLMKERERRRFGELKTWSLLRFLMIRRTIFMMETAMSSSTPATKPRLSTSGRGPSVVLMREERVLSMLRELIMKILEGLLSRSELFKDRSQDTSSRCLEENSSFSGEAKDLDSEISTRLMRLMIVQ